MKILQLLASSSFITLNKNVIKAVGLEEALLLGELSSEHEYWTNKGEMTDGWFYSTVENVEENTTLNDYKQRKAINTLQGMKIIEMERKGIPAKRYFRINEEQLVKLLNLEPINSFRTSSLNFKELEVKNLKNSINKNITKENASPSLRSEDAGNSTSDEDGDCCGTSSDSGKTTDDIFTDLLDEGRNDSSDEELKMVTVLIRKGGFTHRLPAPGKEPSKTIKECISKISDIASANFLKWNFDPEWMKGLCTEKQLRRLSDEVFTFTEAVELVSNVLDDFNQSKEQGYWPRDKKVLPKSFSDFLFNEHTGKSWFINFLVKGAQKLEETDNQKYVDALPAAFRNVLDRTGLEWKEQIPRIARNVVDLGEWHERTKNTLDRYTDYSWLFYREDFWDSYINYVADLLDGDHPCPGHFRPYGKTHQSWMAIEHDEHGVDWSYLGKVKGEKERGYTDEI